MLLFNYSFLQEPHLNCPEGVCKLWFGYPFYFSPALFLLNMDQEVDI